MQDPLPSLDQDSAPLMPEDIGQLKVVFSKYDRNSNGSIDAKELGEVLAGTRSRLCVLLCCIGWLVG